MPDSWEKNQDPSGILPRPELNPLVNPLLENHLGRWAEVYFTSPPEEREQAVEELLRELQRTAQPEADCTTADAKPACLTGIACPDCQFQNLAGQRFCGNCGVQLEKSSSPRSTAPLKATSGSPPVNLSRPADLPRITLADDQPTAEIQWLREKSFSQWDEVKSPTHGRKLLLATFIMIVLAGTWASLRWLYRDFNLQSGPAASVVPEIKQEAPANRPVPPEPAPATAPIQPAEQKLTSPQPIQSHPALPAPSRSMPAVEDGAQELLLAKQDLEAKNGLRDSSQAAKLLWKAVSKRNVQAALLLSDLYVRGEGVTRSCDQARLLLVAAAKKGSSEAAQHLRSLESSGCR